MTTSKKKKKTESSDTSSSEALDSTPTTENQGENPTENPTERKVTKLGYAAAEDAKTDKVLVREDGTYDTSVLSQNQMRFISKYIRANGIVSYACKIAKISRDTYYRWLAENKTFEAIIRRADEEPLDLVRLKLWEQINKGNINAITLYLKAHDRAYSDRMTVSGKVELTPSWYEDLKAKKAPILGTVIQQALDNKQLKELDKAIATGNTPAANALLGGIHDKETSGTTDEEVAGTPEPSTLETVPRDQGTKGDS